MGKLGRTLVNKVCIFRGAGRLTGDLFGLQFAGSLVRGQIGCSKNETRTTLAFVVSRPAQER